jgi:ABC-type sugar transport system permease subunit
VGKDIYREDLKVKERTAIGLISFVPFLAIIFQFGSFLSILSLTGGVFLAATGLIICWMYSAVHPGKNRVELAVIHVIFIAVMVFEIASFLK